MTISYVPGYDAGSMLKLTILLLIDTHYSWTPSESEMKSCDEPRQVITCLSTIASIIVSRRMF